MTLKSFISTGIVLVLCLMLAVAVLFRVPVGSLRAQTPTPSVQFANVVPPSTTVPTVSHGIVVEGLVYGCGTPTALQTAQATVYWLSQGWAVWTELSIYAYCGKTISQVESDLVTITSYVLSNAPSGSLSRWLGIMLDEESSYGFSVNQLVSLNSYVANVLNAFTASPTWLATESFSGQGDWNQNEFNAVTYVSYPAPQIASDYMVTLTNSFYQSFGTPTLVTWSTVYPSNYNSKTESVTPINGTPYSVTFGPWTFFYSNEFCSGSCQ